MRLRGLHEPLTSGADTSFIGVKEILHGDLLTACRRAETKANGGFSLLGQSRMQHIPPNVAADLRGYPHSTTSSLGEEAFEPIGSFLFKRQLHRQVGYWLTSRHPHIFAPIR